MSKYSLSDYLRKKLLALMQISISGVVTKDNLKNWLMEIQDQKHNFLSDCSIKDLEKAAQELGIKVVKNEAEYNKIKHKYRCFYRIPGIEEIKTKEKEITENEILEAKELDGETLKRLYTDEKIPAIDICNMYHISTATLYRYLRKYKIEYRFNMQNRGKVKSKDIETIKKLKKEGETQDNIAKMFGVSRSYIQYILRVKKVDMYKENARLERELEEKNREIERLKQELNLKECC